MSWKPVTESEIQDYIADGVARMEPAQVLLWQSIQIRPEKWSQHPYGDLGGGFWAVGLLGQIVIWFNDIEDGFNWSRWTKYGAIGEYVCNQDELQWIVQDLVNLVMRGRIDRPRLGPPQPI